MLIKVTQVRALPGFRLWLHFVDGHEGVADLSGVVLRDGDAVAPLRDAEYFSRVFIERGAPTWPNGFDLAPWALYDDLSAAGALCKPQTAA